MNKESLEQEVGVVYGKIYGYTDIGGDSVLELMDDWLEEEDKYDLFMEYINEDEFGRDVDLGEVKKLINLLYEILDEVRYAYNM
mgnify:CR=1 FL=1